MLWTSSFMDLGGRLCKIRSARNRSEGEEGGAALKENGDDLSSLFRVAFHSIPLRKLANEKLNAYAQKTKQCLSSSKSGNSLGLISLNNVGSISTAENWGSSSLILCCVFLSSR